MPKDDDDDDHKSGTRLAALAELEIEGISSSATENGSQVAPVELH